MYHKEFPTWFTLKEQLHFKNHQPPLVSEGEIWWVSLGENIGREINGKSQLFSRPVIIYKKLSHGLYLIIPSTTQNKYGNWFVPYRQKNNLNFVCLHQIRTIDFRRLFSKLGRLDDTDFQRIKDGFKKLYV